MPLFVFTAFSRSGAAIRGEQAAGSAEELRAELTARQLLVREIRPRRAAFLSLRHRAGSEDVLLFTQEFRALVRAGLTVPEALALTAKRPDSPALGRTLARVLDDIRGGVPLGAACARHPETFDGVLIAALRTGERTGDLAGALAHCERYLGRRVALHKKVVQALAYPAFLFITLAVILAVLFAFVLPRFAAMYADLGAALPLSTRLLMAVVDRMAVIVPLAAVAAIAMWMAWRRLRAGRAGRLAFDRAAERAPWIGEIGRLVAVAQLARSLSSLLAAGTPLAEALLIAQDAVSGELWRDRIARVRTGVIEGRGFAAALRENGAMPDAALRLVEVGEASGSLDAMLAEVGDYHEGRIEARLARMTALIEPLLMLLMGVLIGGIIIVMYLPVFRMADVIR